MIKVRVVVKSDWVEEGKMLVVNTEQISFAPRVIFDRLGSDEPQRIVICHSDLDALKLKMAIENNDEWELVE